jgi:hypothetical protein
MQQQGRVWRGYAPAVAALAIVLWGACTQQLDLGTQLSSIPDADIPQDVRDQAVGGNDQPGGRRGDFGGPGGMGAAGTIGGSMGCAVMGSRELQVEPGRPLAFVALQRSASMFVKLGERSKLEQAGLALEKVFTGRRLPAGLVQFPDLSPFCTTELSCCASSVMLTPKSDAGRALRKTISCEGQPSFCFQAGKSVPTNAALREIRTFIKNFNVAGQQSVLLITDGDPNCNGVNACDSAVAETAGLLQENTDTYVLPMEAESASTTCLTRIARAGDTLDATAMLSTINTDAELESSLLAAVSRIENGFCELRMRFAPKRPEDVHVFVDGVEVPRTAAKPGGSSFAFSKDSNSRIEIAGTACETLKRQPKDVRAYESCCPNERDCRM